MNWLWAALLAAMLTTTLCLWRDFCGGWISLWFLGWILGVVGVVGFAILICVSTFGPGVDKAACEKFGRQSGYTVKFVRYHVLSWGCLARTANGRWVPRDNLRGVNQ